MRKLEPIIEYEGAKPYWLCPRYGQAMYEENIPDDRKCPNTKSNTGPMGCKEGCYYNYAMEPPNMERERKQKSSKPKIGLSMSKRALDRIHMIYGLPKGILERDTEMVLSRKRNKKSSKKKTCRCNK